MYIDAVYALSLAIKSHADTELGDGTSFIDRVSSRFSDSYTPGDVDLPAPYAIYSIDKGLPIRTMGDGSGDGDAIPFTMSVWSRSPSKQEVLEIGALVNGLFDRSQPDMSDGSYTCNLVYATTRPEIRRVNPFWRWQATFVAQCYPT